MTMILNDFQYALTQEWLAKFQESLDQVRLQLDEGDDNTRKLRRIYEAAFRSERDTLQAQLVEYDELRSGERTVVRVEAVADLPRTLIKARIAAGLTQAELAERLGVLEEDVQHDEETEYGEASLARLTDVAEVLGLTIGTEIVLPSRPVQAA
jgi:ribosome-binding protein aMBF1 (putative translation factor)